MDIVAEFARLARAAPKALCSPALMPFACGSAAVASESTATTMAEMVSGDAGQRQHAWIALDFGTLHLVNVSAVCAQHCSKTPAHLLQVTSLAAPHPPCFQRLSSNCALGSEAAHVTNHFFSFVDTNCTRHAPVLCSPAAGVRASCVARREEMDRRCCRGPLRQRRRRLRRCPRSQCGASGVQMQVCYMFITRINYSSASALKHSGADRH